MDHGIKPCCENSPDSVFVNSVWEDPLCYIVVGKVSCKVLAS